MDDTTQHHVPRLLAIDDSEMIHRLLKGRLRPEHLEIHAATSAGEGLEMSRRLQPEVILLEIDMGRTDGLAVLSQLKNSAETHDIPVIVISATDDTQMKVRCFDLGAMDFVAKPFDLSELRARVRAAVRLRQMMLMLAQRAQIDGLTGLWNRAHFDLRLRQEIAEASRHGSPLALILCDLDRFKTINDTYGHPHGDHVLTEFAQLLAQHRASDIACRYGGEEFAIILPRIGAAEAGTVAQRIREELAGRTWPEQPDLHVTASFGVCDLAMCMQPTAACMIALADRALYDAKQAGRDCVRLAIPPRAA